MTTQAPPDAIQRRTVRTLVGSQVLGGVGLSAGIAVGALLAEDVSGSAKFAGLGATFQVLGAAVIAEGQEWPGHGTKWHPCGTSMARNRG